MKPAIGRPRYDQGPGPLAVLVIVALCLLCAVGWAECVHHDWRCAFAQCRIVTP